MATNLTYNNKIEGFQYNSKSLTCIVYDTSNNLYNLTNYNAYFYMQKFPIRAGQPVDVSISAANIITNQGAILFNLGKSTLDLPSGDYVYEVIIDDGSTNRITVIQDKFSLLDSINR